MSASHTSHSSTAGNGSRTQNPGLQTGIAGPAVPVMVRGTRLQPGKTYGWNQTGSQLQPGPQLQAGGQRGSSAQPEPGAKHTPTERDAASGIAKWTMGTTQIQELSDAPV